MKHRFSALAAAVSTAVMMASPSEALAAGDPHEPSVPPTASAPGEPPAPAPAATQPPSPDPGRVKPDAEAKSADNNSGVMKLLTDVWSKVKLGTKWYIHYESGRKDEETSSRFHVSRGYVTLKLKPVKWFQPRVTLDAHQDDTGDFKVRLKYLHAKFVVPVETAVITEPNIEVGIAHGPWFDYQEHINNYRAEGKMFMERNGLLNSADVGVTVAGLIGKKLDKGYQKRVSKAYPGTYGSFAFGVYNGGGYHAEEKNNDKVFASRVSIRPLGSFLPHWQLSNFFVHGKGNTAEEPDWQLLAFMTSVEHDYFVLTGEVSLGDGNQKGSQVQQGDPSASHNHVGYSFFAEAKLPWIMSSLIGRYDYFDWATDGGPSDNDRIIVGHAFHFLPGNFLLSSFDYVNYRDEGLRSDRQAKLTLQVKWP